MPKKNYYFFDHAIKTSRKSTVPVLENQIHTQIARYLDMVIKRPSRWMTIEVSNQAGGRAAMLRQVALKRRGVTSGTPDIFIWHRNASNELRMIFLEVKVPDGKLTEKQRVLHEELKEEGHEVFITHSVEETKLILEKLGVI